MPFSTAFAFRRFSYSRRRASFIVVSAAALLPTFRAMSFQTFRKDGTITVTPKNEAEQSALVVISHGLGDSAEGFADVAEVSFIVRENWLTQCTASDEALTIFCRLY